MELTYMKDRFAKNIAVAVIVLVNAILRNVVKNGLSIVVVGVAAILIPIVLL
jgi:hypothetical protein